MKKNFFSIAAGVIASSVPVSMNAAEPPVVEMWRLDCGTIEIGNLDDYSDSFLYPGRSMEFTDSCYLIRNGERFILWDTGLPKALEGTKEESGTDRMSLNRSVIGQLAELGITPDQIDFVGISHYHYDHTGQAADFGSSTLLIDRRDWDVVNARQDLSASFTPWISGGSTVQTVTYDHDVFGDGSVIMLKTPGHTPGHRSLLVRLADRGPILLSGDAVHFRENWSRRGVPGFNTSRAESLASMDRIRDVADQLGATLVIQHEPEDIAKLALFPEASH
ncbi:N-acyl homoserine lactonase family protein [Aurantiacibacter zhengii]|uniref:N-acyl homoserine lactonase family protein n=1 Tax=Aurantiacibacter zhengii TaxID=2307003 RepID=A0A418NTU8_9SPHN|nr:N-acyl homoserine lactonase family protein [Aurantiacibacter zhengii]RIV86924.1 N-acyl homoserine lactonase family protein [Aurantiacibacter zhengii]